MKSALTPHIVVDWMTARALIRRVGARLSAYASEGGFPGFGSLRPAITLHVAPGLFGTQFVLVATPG